MASLDRWRALRSSIFVARCCEKSSNRERTALLETGVGRPHRACFILWKTAAMARASILLVGFVRGWREPRQLEYLSQDTALRGCGIAVALRISHRGQPKVLYSGTAHHRGHDLLG